jgi:hypothetical protein
VRSWRQRRWTILDYHGGMPPSRTPLPCCSLLTLLVAVASCATTNPAPKRNVTMTADLTMGKLGASKADPYPTCGPGDSYRFVAEDFVCPDGSNPFRGDHEAAARSRRGNVGPHLEVPPENVFESHIVDHYVVPCPAGPIDVYVCMYHCPKQ